MQATVRRSKTLVIGLALVLAAFVRPVEGLVFYEQREASRPPIPQLRADAQQAVVDLSGRWEYRIGDKGAFQPCWMPVCFAGEEAVLEFRRRFNLPDSLRNLHFQLHLPEISYSAEAWVNGSLVSSFAGHHLGMRCDLAPGLLQFGSSNEILLRVDNELTPRSTLPVRMRFLGPRNYGGVFSGVFLRGVPELSVEDVGMTVESLRDSTAIRGTVHVRLAQYQSRAVRQDSAHGGRDARLYVTLCDTSRRMVFDVWSERIQHSSGEGFVVNVSAPRFAASPWTPGRPVLYDLTASLVAGADTLHRLTRRVGFKTVEARDGDLYLNGQRLRLRGVDYIIESSRGGRAVAPSQIRQDLSAIRELGMNAVRVPFDPPSPDLLNAADEIGLLVLAELGLDWIPGDVLTRPTYRALVRHSADAFLETCADHVCVLGWGIGSNLDWKDPATREFTSWLRTRMREQDNRPCYIETIDPRETATLADFVLAAWRPDEQPPFSADLSNVPIVQSRLGRLVRFNSASSDETPGIINQAEFIIRRVLELERDETGDGYLIHAFADYYGQSPLMAQPEQSDPLLYTYGLLTADRQERLAYSKLRDLVRTGQAVPPLKQERREHPPISFPAVGLAALLFLSIELRRNNVFRQNLKRVFLHAHGFYSDLRYRRFLHGAQPLILWLLESITLALLLASGLHALRTSTALDYYLSHFVPWPHFKASLINLIWDPVWSIVWLTGFFMVLLMLKALAIRITSMLFRERVDIWQSANYVVWAFAALLYLLPLAVVFDRALATPRFATVACVAVAAGVGWSGLRLMTALRTGLATSAWRVWGVVLAAGLLAAMAVVLVLDNQLGTLAYLDFYQQVMTVR